MTRYNLANIRTLLIEGFTAEELRHFCFDTPEIRPVYNKLASNTGKAEIVDQLLEYAERRLLLDAILTWAKKQNPACYEKHLPLPPGNNSGGPPELNTKILISEAIAIISYLPGIWISSHLVLLSAFRAVQFYRIPT